MNDSEPSSPPAEAPWYRRAFRKEYADLYAHRDQADARRAVDLLAQGLDLRHGLRVLDLGCGAGRHLALMAPRIAPGAAVGLDLSRSLLARARGLRDRSPATSASGRDRPVYSLLEADMRAIPFARGSFGAVFNLFTSFGYFTDDGENLGVLREVARVLEPRGRFVIDHINRPYLEATLLKRSERRLQGGIRVVESRSFDPAARRVDKTVIWDDPRAPGPVRWTESVRVYEADEIRSMLSEAGLAVRRVFGDFDGSERSARSPRMIVLAEKTAAHSIVA